MNLFFLAVFKICKSQENKSRITEFDRESRKGDTKRVKKGNSSKTLKGQIICLK
jgi:hypothetical protein